MVKIRDKRNCTGCGACVAVCPRDCIRMAEDREGFLYPEVDVDRCIRCGACLRACPTLQKCEGSQPPAVYAAVSLDDETRSQSSSGGVFSLVASYILDRGGVVFGAAFDPEGNVVHTAVRTREGLSALRGSKYVQSRIGGAYREARELLEQGVPVYFTGTPCQIEGLLKFLKKDYSHLLTQDLICHGVPSPLAFREYIAYQEKRHGAASTKILFRKKDPAIKPYLIDIEFENGRHYACAANEDPYMKAFLRDFSLRPSCYDCRFKGVGRVSDITLADYWGIDKVHPDFASGDGVSLVWIHSSKGAHAFEALQGKMKVIPSDLERAVAFNRAAIFSAKKPPGRSRFMHSLERMDFSEAVERFCRASLAVRLKRKAKSIIKKILR